MGMPPYFMKSVAFSFIITKNPKGARYAFL